MIECVGCRRPVEERQEADAELLALGIAVHDSDACRTALDGAIDASEAEVVAAGKASRRPPNFGENFSRP